VMDSTAKTHKAGFEMSEKLRRLDCKYCDTANPVGEPRCIACGAPLGSSQPGTCTKCGQVVAKNARFCPNCGQSL
jgi:predicted amidophosphoribosyltransferase